MLDLFYIRSASGSGSGTRKHLMLLAMLVGCCWTATQGMTVSKVTPRFGSKAGGTRITVNGLDFAGDLFQSMDASGEEKSVKLWLVGENQRYATDIHPDGCTGIQITAYTRPMPEGTYRLQPEVNGVAMREQDICTATRCLFLVRGWNTPTVNKLSPRAGSRGTKLKIEGQIMTSKVNETILAKNSTNNVTDTLHKAILGDNLCDLADDMGRFYEVFLNGPDNSWRSGFFKCRVVSQSVGSFNFSYRVTNAFGRSFIEEDVYIATAKNKIAMYQNHAVISSVSLSSGSTFGGTLVELLGDLLDDETNAPLQVLFAGIPATIVEKSRRRLLVSSPPEVTGQTHYSGNRGVTVYLFRGYKSDPIEDVDAHDLADARVEFHSDEARFALSNQDYVDQTLHHGRMVGMFVVPNTGSYRWYMHGSCVSRLYVSTDHTPENKVRLIDSTFFDREFSLSEESIRSAQEFSYTEGERYYFEVNFRCNRHSFVETSVFLYDTVFTHSMIGRAVDDVQRIAITSTIVPLTQPLDLRSYEDDAGGNDVEVQTVSVSVRDPQDTFRLGINNAYTDLLTVDSDANTVQEYLEDLPTVYFTREISVEKTTSQDTRAVFTFTMRGNRGAWDLIQHMEDSGVTVSVTRNSAGNPQPSWFQLAYPSSEPRGQPYVSNYLPLPPTVEQLTEAISTLLSVQCPESIANPSRRVAFYHQQYEGEVTVPESGTRVTEDEPFCGLSSNKAPQVLYKYDKDTDHDVKINLNVYPWICLAHKGHFAEGIIIDYLEEGQQKTVTLPYTFNSDGEWHYICHNLDVAMGEAVGEEHRPFSVVGMKVAPDTQYVPTDTFIDSFAIMNRAVDGADVMSERRSKPPVRAVKDLIQVTETSELLYNLQVTIENCQEPETIRVLHSSTVPRASTTHTGPVTGSFSLSWDDPEGDTHNAGPFDADVTAQAMKNTLQTNPAFGKIAVTRTGSCAGYSYDLRFATTPGRQAEITTSGSVRGQGARIDVHHIRHGGVLYQPLLGDMLATHHTVPQIVAIVNDIPASCEDSVEGTCDFEWSAARTPTYTLITPTNGPVGTSVTLSVTGADTSRTSNNVILLSGDAGYFTVTSVPDENTVVATLQQAPLGVHAVTFRVLGKGLAELLGSPMTFSVEGGITSIEPTSGVEGGGLILTAVGSGFDARTTTLTVGGNDCDPYDLPSWTASILYCVIPKGTAGAPVDVIATVNGNQVTSPTQYTYTDTGIPTITGVSATTGTAAGGEMITITGTDFGTVKITDRPSRVGGVAVTYIESFTDTEVVLALPPLPNGVHDIMLYIQDVGYAAQSTDSGPVYPTITVDFTLTSLTPEICSPYGGCQVRFEGTGFSGEPDDYDITVSAAPCTPYDIQPTYIECILEDTAVVHEVTNGGTDDTWGTGYAWEPSIITIEKNSFVRWSWDAFGSVQFKVQQTPDQNSEPDGNGFDSGAASRTGSFLQRFTEAGDYHYYSGIVVANFVMRGIVRVVEMDDTLHNVTFTLNGAAPEIVTSPSRRRRALSTCPLPTPAGCTAPDDGGNMMTLSTLPCMVGSVDSFGHIDASSGDLRRQVTATETLTLTTTDLGTTTTSCVEVKLIPQGGTSDESYDCSLTSIAGNGTVECDIDTEDTMAVGEVYEVYVVLQPVGYVPLNIMTYAERVMQLQSEITAISPTAVAVTGGAKITVTGSGFDANTEVLIDSTTCQIYNNMITYTQVVCVAPSRSSDYTGELQVVVNGVASVCSVSPNCEVSLTDADTPHATSITPDTMSTRTTFTIAGDNFGTDSSAVDVTIGGNECVVSTVTETSIQCEAASVPLGPAQPVEVFVGGVGHAVTLNGGGDPLTVASTASLAAVDVTQGSEAGGTAIVITGNGFSEGATTVSIDSVACEIQSITAAHTLTCITGAHAAGTHNIDVTVDNEAYPTSLTFEYVSAITPTITHNGVSPTSGVSGDSITITGTQFSTTPADNTVTVGDTECVVTAATATEIQCDLGDNAAGSVPVQVLVSGVGYAAPLDAGGAQAINTPPMFEYLISLTAISPLTGSHSGGAVLTLTGEGLSTSSTVTVCDEECTNVQGTATELTCITPPSAQGSGEVACDVLVCHGGCTAPSTHTYSDAATPTVTAVEPTRGGTGGNSLITIRGSSFGTTQDDVTVTLADVPCTVEDLDDTSILCRTGPKRPSVQTRVVVTVAGKGQALEVDGGGAFEYIDMWSSPFSWGDDLQVPVDGDFVIVPRGQHIVVDGETAVLKMLFIRGGTVSFDPERDATLHAENILIMDGGQFLIGTEEEPYLREAVVQMHGKFRAPELPVYGTKTLAVRDGLLSMHGRPVDITWTLLAQTANAGARTIQLQLPPPWRVGDEIIIATTGDYMSQGENEVHTIQAISGSTITLEDSLEFTHQGFTDTFRECGAEAEIEVRAEVGLLTRNIKFRGDGDPAWEEVIPACPDGFNPGEFATQTCFQGRFGEEMGSDEFGGAIMAHNPAMNSGLAVIQMDSVELTHVGQAFRLGRYPIHFHMNGDMDASYVRNCAIHKAFNRAINIHNSHNIRITNNVAYDVKGGAFFLEDSIEHGNVFQQNLLVFVRASSSLLNDDLTPAAFWITFPDNVIENNHVAGGTHFGFWYRMLEHPEGPSKNESICPRNVELGSFRNNTGHSLGWYTLWVFELYTPKLGGCCNCREHVAAKFEDITAWNCFRGVEFAECSTCQFHGVKAANNFMSNIEWLEVMEYPPLFTEDQSPRIHDSMLAGYLRYPDHPPPTRRGLVLPFGHGVLIDGICFDRFDGSRNDITSSAIGLVKITCVCSNYCGTFKYRFKDVTFTSTTDHLAYTEWVFMWQLEDYDGSLTGIAPRNGHFAHVVANTPLYNQDKCHVSAGFSTYDGDIQVESVICEPGVDFAEFIFHEVHPETLHGFELLVTNRYNREMRLPEHIKNSHHMKYGWRILAELPDPADYDGPNEYVMKFEHQEAITNFTYSGRVYNMIPDRHLVLTHDLARDGAWDQTQIVPEVNLTADVGRLLSYPEDRYGAWHFNTQTNDLSYMVSDTLEDEEGVYIEKSYDIELRATQCVYDGCAIPEQGQGVEATAERPNGTLRWSDPAAWGTAVFWYLESGAQGIGLPSSDAVTIHIPEGEWLLLDMEIPDVFVETINIEGTLEIEDEPGRHYQINANYIVVLGAFIVGWEDDEFEEAEVTVWLRGDISTPDFELDNATPMGAKAIGVYGQLDMHGAPVSHRWLPLSHTARAGDTELFLSAPVRGWHVGDLVLVTPTSYHPTEGEKRRIVEIVDNQRLVIDEPLEYTHIANGEEVEGKRYDIRAEVGRLSSNVRVRAVYEESEDSDYGGRVVVTQRGIVNDEGEMLAYSGLGRLSNIEFQNMGQKGFIDPFDPRMSLAFTQVGHSTASEAITWGPGGSPPDEDPDALPRLERGVQYEEPYQETVSIRPSYVVSCAFHENYSPAVGVFDADGVTVRDNVVHRTVGNGMTIYGHRHKVMHNLVSECLATSNYKANGTDHYHHAGIDSYDSVDVLLRDNVVAGSQRSAYLTKGDACPSSPAFTRKRYRNTNNVGRSLYHGLLNLYYYQPLGKQGSCRESEGCSLYQGFTIMRAHGYGIYYTSPCSVILNEMGFVDVGVGSIFFVAFPSSVYHQYQKKTVRITNSLYVGQSRFTNCTHDHVIAGTSYIDSAIQSKPLYRDKYMYRGNTYRSGKTGFVWGTFGSKAMFAPIKPMLFLKFFVTFYGEYFIENSVFAHYGTGCFGMKNFMISTNPKNDDFFHPMFSSGLRLHNVDREAMAYIGRPSDENISPAECGDMECDSHKKALWQDRDGSLLGAPGFVMPRADLSWDREPGRGIGDHRIPRPMQVDNRGDRLPMDEVYHHTGLHIPEGTSEWVTSSVAYFVHSQYTYRNIFLESLDPDWAERKLSPIAIRSHNDLYIDLSNGPKSIGICAGYACNFRLGMYPFVVGLGETYDIFMTSTPPQAFRFHMLTPTDVTEVEKVKLCIFMDGLMRPDVYYNETYQLPLNARRDSSNRIDYVESPNGDRSYYTDQFDRSEECGVNMMNTESDMLCLIMCSDVPLVVRVTPVVLLKLGLPTIREEDFFGENVVENLALLLGVSPNQVRIVEAVPETARRRRRDLRHLRKRRDVDVTVYIVEIGDNPPTTVAEPDNTVFIQEPGEDDVVSGETVLGDIPEVTADIPTYDNARVLTESSLSQISVQLSTALTDGSLANNLNIEIVMFDVAVAPPSPGSAQWEEKLNETETQTLPPLVDDDVRRPPVYIPGYEWGLGGGVVVDTDPIPHPDRLEIIQAPEAVCEGLPFTKQPVIDIVNAEGELEMGTGGWIVTAELVTSPSSSTQHPDAQLFGTTSVRSINGRALFTNLGVTHRGNSYQIRFYVSNPSDQPFDRMLTGLFIPARIYSVDLSHEVVTVNDQFDLTVTVMDRNGEVARNMAWQGHSYDVTVRLISSSASMNASHLTAPVDLVTSQATFPNMVIDRAGLYAVQINIRSFPGDYNTNSQAMIRVMDHDYEPPVAVETSQVQLKINADYDVINDREMEFAVVMYEALDLPESVNAHNFLFERGSIIVTFDLTGTNTALTSALHDIEDFAAAESKVVFNGRTLVFTDYMIVDGYEYASSGRSTDDDDDDKKVPLVLIIVPIVCVLIVLVIVVVAVYFITKKNKGQRKNGGGSDTWNNKTEPYNPPYGDEVPPAYSSEMFTMPNNGEDVGSITKVPLSTTPTATAPEYRSTARRRSSTYQVDAPKVTLVSRSSVTLTPEETGLVSRPGSLAPGSSDPGSRPMSRTSHTTSAMGDAEKRRTSVVVPSIG